MNAIFQLNELRCFHLQLRIFNSEFVSIRTLLDCINEIQKLSFRSLSLIINYSLYTRIKEFITSEVSKIMSLVIYNTPESEPVNNSDKRLLFHNKTMEQNSCGIVNYKYFSIAIDHIAESINHNTCLNRKISIDVNGEIKNCPSMKESFGNIKDTTLEEALNKKGFKKLWSINKNKVKVCQDCEFRYVCTDCRAYIEDPNDIHSKPLKCGYDPHTGVWEEWITNPLKQKAIKYYGIQELVKTTVKNEKAKVAKE